MLTACASYVCPPSQGAKIFVKCVVRIHTACANYAKPLFVSLSATQKRGIPMEIPFASFVTATSIIMNGLGLEEVTTALE